MLRAWLVPILLAGLLPLPLETLSRWPVATVWAFPVGDPSPSSGEPAYAATRNVGGPGRHQGADLSNRREGGLVRAAADGIVVVTGARARDDSYGERVVLAHRLAEGGLAYTVYAHLAPRSIVVAPGAIVAVGTPLGRIGRTGDATAPHLHFEVRLARDPQERWERGTVVDPIEFLSRRQAEAAADTSSPR